jgi:anti-sigma factor RsiW
MNCRYVHARLSAYIDGELAGSEMLAIRSHVAHCEDCSREEAEIRAFKRALGSLPSVVPPDGFEEKLLRAVRTSELRTPAFGGLRLAPYAVALALSAVLLAAVAFRPRQASPANNPPTVAQSFELSRDQAYVAGTDPLGGGPVAIPVSYAQH